MSTRTYLVDASTRRAIFTLQYSRGRELFAAEQVRNILFETIGIVEGNRRGIELNTTEFIRLKFDDLKNDIAEELESFSVDESEFTHEMLSNVSRKEPELPSPQIIRQSVPYHLMNLEGERISISGALNQFGEAKTQQVTQIIRDGFTEGKTQQQLGQDIRSIIPLQARQVGSLVRTVTNAASSGARNETYRANDDILLGYRWISTLDGRTSLICISRDQHVYNLGGPMPPAHWSCRSTTVPEVDPEFDLASGLAGSRPAVGQGGVQQVSGITSYATWIKRQPKAFQEKVLGKARAKLYRSGQFTIDQFVDYSGSTINLVELKRLNPLAFERAGVLIN